MTDTDIRSTVTAMPRHNPSYPPGPYRFEGREYFTVDYETDLEALHWAVPEPLTPIGNIARIEFVRMPNSTGFGAYNGVSQVIPVSFDGQEGVYTRLMFLDAHPPIAGGRELWGFPQKLAGPKLSVEKDTLIGRLAFGPVDVAIGTMGYKHRQVATDSVLAGLQQPGFLLKIIPDVSGRPAVCEIVCYRREEITVGGAWSGPAALALYPHALAPLNALPVRRVVAASHFVTDYVLALGRVVHDYLA